MEKTVLELTSELCGILRENYFTQCGSRLNYDFVIAPGRKYLKVVTVDDSNHRSVHGFVDKKTGDLLKPASWNAPAKGVRYNLVRDIESLRTIGMTMGNMWCGSYLYRR